MSDHDTQDTPAEQRVLDASAAGCAEARLLLSRRALMGLSASFIAWSHVPRIASASSGSDPDPRLVVVLLRGALDGLSLVPPRDIKDSNILVEKRNGLVLPTESLFSLKTYAQDIPLEERANTDFYLHPAFKNFNDHFNAGDAAIIHAIAPPLQSRSHFHCMDNLESGYPKSFRTAKDGWLGRVLNELPVARRSALKGISFGLTPLTLLGASDLMSWTNDRVSISHIHTKLIDLYEKTDPELHGLLLQGVTTNDLALDFGELIPSDDRRADDWTPANGKLRRADDLKLEETFRGAARMLRLPGGPRIGVIDTTGWDTHAGQLGSLNTKFKELDRALGGFATEMKKDNDDVWNRTVVVLVTEFGRSVTINGSGTDHGVGTVALLMGGAVNGGHVWGKWDGLSNLLDQRDLTPTTDIRQLFKGLVRDHLQMADATVNRVFEESTLQTPLQDLLKTPSVAIRPMT